MNTIKLYDDLPYEKEFEAKILSLESEKGHLFVQLDRTLFFPMEGGQSSDTGELEGLKVLHVSIENGRIVHELLSEDPCPLKEGMKVRGRIDFERRFSNMQNHTGEHILSGILHNDYSSENMGFHLSDNVVTLDTSKALSGEEISELELKANRVVFENRNINCRYYDKKELSGIRYRSKKEIEGDIRLVEIEGIDLCACCAPHLRSTAEAGMIKIIRSENYKGGTRLYFLCGMRALEYFSEISGITSGLCRLLSSKEEELIPSVEKLLNTIDTMKAKKEDVLKERILSKIKDLDEGIPGVMVFAPDINNITARKIVNSLTERHKGRCGIFFGEEGSKAYRFIISDPLGDSREAVSLLKERFGAKGGGSREMVQGSLEASFEELSPLFGEERVICC